MKHHIRTLACGAALLAAVACGGKQTIASKSAAAYDEAMKKGIPIASGEHGGHSAETGTEPMPKMDPSTMSGMDHVMAGMQHGTSGSGANDQAGMHSTMVGMDHAKMAGMDHSEMPGMQGAASGAAAHDMAGMDHAAMPGMTHGSTPGMTHGSMPGMQAGGAMAGMPGMQHGSPAAAPAVMAPPASNAAIAQTQPDATLRADEFDTPAPASVEEAVKGASGMSHSMESATPKPPTPKQHDHNSRPPSEHPGDGEAS